MSCFFLIMYFIKCKAVKLKFWFKPTKAMKFSTLLTYFICSVNATYNRKVSNCSKAITLPLQPVKWFEKIYWSIRAFHFFFSVKANIIICLKIFLATCIHACFYHNNAENEKSCFCAFFKVKPSGLNLIGKKKKDHANLQYRHETKPNSSLHLCLFLI